MNYKTYPRIPLHSQGQLCHGLSYGIICKYFTEVPRRAIGWHSELLGGLEGFEKGSRIQMEESGSEASQGLSE